MTDEFLKFEDWEKTIADYIKKDPLWESLYYRVALYLYDLVWDDCEILQKDFKARHNISQLIRSSGSISANMEEAVGRGVGTPDYIRIMKLMLRSNARNARFISLCWCFLPKSDMNVALRTPTSLVVRNISYENQPW